MSCLDLIIQINEPVNTRKIRNPCSPGAIPAPRSFLHYTWCLEPSLRKLSTIIQKRTSFSRSEKPKDGVWEPQERAASVCFHTCFPGGRWAPAAWVVPVSFILQGITLFSSFTTPSGGECRRKILIHMEPCVHQVGCLSEATPNAVNPGCYWAQDSSVGIPSDKPDTIIECLTFGLCCLLECLFLPRGDKTQGSHMLDESPPLSHTPSP